MNPHNQSKQSKQTMTRFRGWRNRLFRPHHGQQGVFVLTNRDIYIFPNRIGWAAFVLWLIMFGCSINYGLSLGFGFCFLLVGLVVSSAIIGHRNLQGVRCTLVDAPAVFAGEAPLMHLQLDNPSRLPRFALRVRARGYTPKTYDEIHLPSHTQKAASITTTPQPRGLMPWPRLIIESDYPLGWLRVWSYVDTTEVTSIYPAPETPTPELPARMAGDHAQHQLGQGREEIIGVRPHQAHDGWRDIAWKASAKGVLVSKALGGHEGSNVLLAWDDLPEDWSLDQKLSRLCAWVITCEHSGRMYGLQSAHTPTLFAQGAMHYHRLLSQLADTHTTP